MTELPPPLTRRFRDRSGREASNLLDFHDGRPLDPGGVSDLIGYGCLAGRRTLLEGVTAVVPSWSLPAPAVHPLELGPNPRADHLWELLLAAVDRSCSGRTRTTLSGGLDSRAVAAALAELAPSGCSAGTFGDPDCDDLPVARRTAAALGLDHEVNLFPLDVALTHEARVWRAGGGVGGPASAPGAATDQLWAQRCDVLLSGTAGDVIWGASHRPGPSPARRAKGLGIRSVAPRWDDEVPPAPSWASPAGAAAWQNLWTRQAGGTWTGAMSRLPFTPVAPVLWDEPLLAFCLALGDEDRRDRALVQRMLSRHAPAVSTDAIPLSVRGPVHDLDRAMRGEAWTLELDRWLRETRFEAVGLRPRGVRQLVSKIRAGRNRAGSLSRVRALSRWADRPAP